MSTRFLADENFPLPTVKALRDVGHDVVCVGEIAGGIDDSQVLNMARREYRVLLTCDKDFGTLAFHSHLRNRTGARPDNKPVPVYA